MTPPPLEVTSPRQTHGTWLWVALTPLLANFKKLLAVTFAAFKCWGTQATAFVTIFLQRLPFDQLCWQLTAMLRLLNFVAEGVFNVLLPLETVMDYVQQQLNNQVVRAIITFYEKELCSWSLYADEFPTFYYWSSAPLVRQMARVPYRKKTLLFPSLPYMEETVLLMWQCLIALVSKFNISIHLYILLTSEYSVTHCVARFYR